MAEIRWTLEAVDWLEKIHAYIRKDSPDSAAKVIEGIYDKVQLLRDFPRIGYLYQEVSLGEIRVILYGHYRITYLIRSESIDILGIFHGAMEIERYLDLPEE